MTRPAKFKRGEMLLVQGGAFHGTLVKYLRADHSGEKIVVASMVNGAEILLDRHRVIKSARRTNSPKKQSGSRLILAICTDCGLKIRATGNWFRLGTPRCFNEQCPSTKDLHMAEGEYAIGNKLEIEWGERGDGVLGQDMREVGRQQQRELRGTHGKGEE